VNEGQRLLCSSRRPIGGLQQRYSPQTGYCIACQTCRSPFFRGLYHPLRHQSTVLGSSRSRPSFERLMVSAITTGAAKTPSNKPRPSLHGVRQGPEWLRCGRESETERSPGKCPEFAPSSTPRVRLPHAPGPGSLRQRSGQRVQALQSFVVAIGRSERGDCGRKSRHRFRTRQPPFADWVGLASSSVTRSDGVLYSRNPGIVCGP